ncbi:hypothetical protein L3Q82_005172 [Scortum barcoo]|uniref:Uncharacterized protein n=1 Tax=Scortum barcoo TaxID=214431 RepID=A0ACB8V9R7_9TELE|nr:hypothetical protein L3Q82_005172 [Scortum barcoo]
MAAELGSYKQAHTSSPPHPGQLQSSGGSSPSQGAGFQSPSYAWRDWVVEAPCHDCYPNHIAPAPHGPSCGGGEPTGRHGPTSPFRAEPGRVPWAKTRPPGARLQPEPQPQAWLQGGAPEGCPGLCNNNGRCTLEASGWHCICQSGWRGAGCHVAMETLCTDGKDNEGDGLSDCMDPDCCLQPSCQNQLYCKGSPDPAEVLSQSPSSLAPQQAARSFYQRIHFLLGPESTHVISGDNPFNKSLVSIIRGQVLTADGTPLIGVNVTFVHYPEHGYTITRKDGMFDLLASGGASLTLSFERAPFLTQYRTVWVPWNVFYVMDTLIMKKVLQEETSIPGSDLNLIYLSSRTVGYKPVLKVTMTQSSIPFNLMKDSCERLLQLLSVGFEYESCLDLILWEKRTSILQGYELDASNMGGWTLDKHHILDLQNDNCLSSAPIHPSIFIRLVRDRVAEAAV